MSPEPRTQETIIAAAKAEHDRECSCDPRYLMSCGKMAAAILRQGRRQVDALRKELERAEDAKAKWRRQAETGADMIEQLIADLAAAQAELDEATKRITDTLSDLDDYIRDTDGISGEEVISDAIKTLRGRWQPAPAAGDMAGQDGASTQDAASPQSLALSRAAVPDKTEEQVTAGQDGAV